MKRKRGKTKVPVPPTKQPGAVSVKEALDTPHIADEFDSVRLARLAEDIWRLDKRASRETDAEWLAPFLERLADDLHELGVEIIDRTGTPYQDGETLEVLHSDVPVGWPGARIVTEVIAPVIRIEGHVRAKGKVVLGPAKID